MNNYVLLDETTYRNDNDGIYKFDTGSKFAILYGGYNKSGFTGNDLVPVEVDKPKVLFIGDSHTFGIDARPIMQKRFVSLVENAGYYTYNAGIGGLDVVQYGLIARKYIPELHLDYVALMLYLGNDINRPPSPVAPGKHLHFQTNFGGWIQGYDDFGYSFNSAEEAVEYRLKTRCGTSLHPTFRYMLKSKLFQKLYIFYYDFIKSFSKSRITSYNNEWVADTIADIANLARQQHSKFILFVIPHRKRLSIDQIEHEVKFLRERGFNPLYPTNLNRDDYQDKGGDHMTNSGHYKYSEFIREILDSDLARQ